MQQRFIPTRLDNAFSGHPGARWCLAPLLVLPAVPRRGLRPALAAGQPQ